ncbi:MAG: hypothetical protein IJO88_02020 [Oscillospiraceae bacterium]|nr:hypothetical protein [Oscillospiraceae bacterium]
MKNIDEKLLMWEAATLYYKDGYTQQQIAERMDITRQTVSRLIGDAVRENIVEIKIHDPQQDREELETLLCERFGLNSAAVCAVSGKNDDLRQLMTVKSAVSYLQPILSSGSMNIAVSWGRTIRDLIQALPQLCAPDTTVFPLFGATDVEDTCFSSNEMARSLSDKLCAKARYAWFPYLTENEQDLLLLKNTGYYKKIEALWGQIDFAIVGIGNKDIVSRFGSIIGCPVETGCIAGDIATHFFDENGRLIHTETHKLCASAEDLRKAKKTIAIACGSEKTDAIRGALRTGFIHTLVTDEHTARQILAL